MKLHHYAAATITTALVILFAGNTATADRSAERVTATDAHDRTITRGGIVRIGPSTYLHTNDTHASIGVTSVSIVNGCYLRVRFDMQPGERIVSAVVDEDETISRLDVQAGVSGGGYTAEVRLYRDGRPVCANDRMFGSTSNLWVSMTYLAPAGPVEEAPAPEATTPPPAAPTTPAPAPSTPTSEPSTPAPSPTVTEPTP